MIIHFLFRIRLVEKPYGKDVWVFEQTDSYVEFPIPYLTDYMIYNLEDPNHFDYVRDIIEGYANPIYLLPLGINNRAKRNIPKGIAVTCPHPSCGSHYSMHTALLPPDFVCPSCRQQVQIEV